MEQFTTTDVCRICDIKLQARLFPWMNAGFITPSIEKADGQGTRNLFSRFDLYKIALFKKVVESGLDRKTAALFLKTNIEFGGMDPKDGTLFMSWYRVDGRWKGLLLHQRFDEPYSYYQSADYYMAEFGTADLVFMVNIHGLMKEVDSKV